MISRHPSSLICSESPFPQCTCVTLVQFIEIDFGKPISREAKPDISRVQQYCVSLSDKGDLLFADDAVNQEEVGTRASMSEEYLVLDTAT